MIRSIGIVLILVLVGCAPSRTYQVQVTNQLSKPVTVWLTKNGPPEERKWWSPEDWAIAQPGDNEQISGVVIPSGKAASTPKISGRFHRGTDAVLRVYIGEQTISGMAAISRGSPNRIDYTLMPGPNELVITDRGGETRVEPTN
jgi:hypothetical protein